MIIETNKTTARIFPEVPDCETPQFWEHMEKLIVLNRCALLPCSSCMLAANVGADAALEALRSDSQLLGCWCYKTLSSALLLPLRCLLRLTIFVLGPTKPTGSSLRLAPAMRQSL